jgi:hypothetical protein
MIRIGNGSEMSEPEMADALGIDIENMSDEEAKELGNAMMDQLFAAMEMAMGKERFVRWLTDVTRRQN